jgi:hypothetical protein
LQQQQREGKKKKEKQQRGSMKGDTKEVDIMHGTLHLPLKK